MKNWDKTLALAEIDKLIDKIYELRNNNRNSAEHVRWFINALQFLEDVFGANSRFYLSFAHITWHETGSFVVTGTYDFQDAIDRRHQDAYVRKLDSAKGMLLSAKDYLESSTIEEVYDGMNTKAEASEILKIIGFAEKQLRKTIRKTPENEREVQDKFEDILIGSEISYSREKEHIEYSAKNYIPDFTFKKIGLAVEIKLCNRENRIKEIIAEINDDIVAYKQSFPNIVFLIYDVGFIRDIDTYTNMIETSSDVVVRIVKH